MGYEGYGYDNYDGYGNGYGYGYGGLRPVYVLINYFIKSYVTYFDNRDFLLVSQLKWRISSCELLSLLVKKEIVIIILTIFSLLCIFVITIMQAQN